MEYLTILSNELSKIDGVSNIEEKLLKNGGKTTKAYQINFDYEKFPLSGLEILDDSGFRFINIRLTISYQKSKHAEIDVLNMINEFNSMSVCLKAFYVENKDSKEFDIVYNIEDVLLEKEKPLVSIFEKKVDMLIRGPLSIHKEMEKE